jgi:glycogen operon protein
LSFLLRGEAGEYHLTKHGEPQPDDSFFVVLNAAFEPVEWVLPAPEIGRRWERLIDTDLDDPFAPAGFGDGEWYEVAARSLVLFVRRNG